ncbi:hemerythrin domain-containing protein [Magnetovibrio sp. PR-2]|uniref:bacteriohemerythrin n=1 Tax=Magnetovibrio sp. PR-2 TaxID=3120356 RepID=UPI002FCE2C61
MYKPIWGIPHIGIEAIDHDHQHIVHLMNKLDHEHLTEEELRRVVEQLISYTQYHYRREEVVMDICGYPDKERHCELHDFVKNKVRKLDEDWRKERTVENLHKLQNLLHSIWLDHIIEEDSESMTYARGRELEINQALLEIEIFDPH